MPGSSSRSMRSRASSLPRERWRSIARSPPPRATSAVRARSSSTSACIRARRRSNSSVRSTCDSSSATRQSLLLGRVGSARMCFELDSLPPIPVVRGASVSHEDLVLEAADGNRFAAFVGHARAAGRDGRRRAAGRARPLPLLRGARAALRRARATRRSRSTTSAGRPASASATTTSPTRTTSPRRPRTGSRRTSRAAVDAAPRRTAPRRSSPSASASAAATRGSRRPPATASPARSASTAGRESGTAIARPDAARGRDRRRRSSRSRPATTQNITPELNAAFEAALSAAGVEHELVVYDGAPHSFFDRRYEEHAEASADAWQRVLAFIEQHAA